MVGALITIGILLFLVLIHEFGHFLMAKLTGVGVDEFGIGYPPKIFRIGQWGGTDYTVNAIPLGGFVRLHGDDAETIEDMGSSKTEDDRNKEKPVGSKFSDQSIPVRLLIVFGGPFINMLFGVLAFAFIYTRTGVPQNYPHPMVETVVVSSPAEHSGLQKGDSLKFVNGLETKSSQEFIDAVAAHRGQVITLTIARSGQDTVITMPVRTQEETPQGEGALGITLTDLYYYKDTWWKLIIPSVQRGLQDSWVFVQLMAKALQQIGIQLVARKLPEEFSGPIGIVSDVNKSGFLNNGWESAVILAGLISINLGFMNMLPIPPLDGGRGMLTILEKVIGKKRRQTLEHYMGTVGMVVLLGLMAVVSLRDVWKILPH